MKKEIRNKLNLNKQTVSNLTNEHMNLIKGGIISLPYCMKGVEPEGGKAAGAGAAAGKAPKIAKK